MKTKLLISGVAAAGIGLAVVSYVKSQKADDSTTPTEAVENSAAFADKSTTSKDTAGPCNFPEGWKGSYAYAGTASTRLTLAGAGQESNGINSVAGKLAFERVMQTSDGEWILLGQMTQLNKEFVRQSGNDVETAFLVKVGDSCEVRGFARLKTVSKKTAQVQQVVIHDLWMKAPLNGSTAALQYENGTGFANATFSKSGNFLKRTIGSYQSIHRTPLVMKVTQSLAQATLDGNWFSKFQSVEGISGGVLQSATAEISLEKDSAATTTVLPASLSRNTNDYVWENLLAGTYSETNAAGELDIPKSEQAYAQAMKNVTMEQAFESVMQKVHDNANIEDQWHELTGFLNSHPEQIREFARGMKEPDFPEEMKGVSYLALSKASSPNARDALLVMRRDKAAGFQDRIRANLALVTRPDVGVALAKEMAADSDVGQSSRSPYARNTLMHLGVLAATHPSDTEVFSVAKSAIQASVSIAGTDQEELSSVLGAVGNLADPGLLSRIEALSKSPNDEIRKLVPQGFRRYAYSVVEPIWIEWLKRETNPDVWGEILNTAYHQLADAQTTANEAMVNEAARILLAQPSVFSRQPAIHILGQTKDKFAVAKQALLKQMPLEFRSQSGLYTQISHYLSPKETTFVLSQMNEFDHQFGADVKAKAKADMLREERERKAEVHADYQTLIGAQ